MKESHYLHFHGGGGGNTATCLKSHNQGVNLGMSDRKACVINHSDTSRFTSADLTPHSTGLSSGGSWLSLGARIKMNLKHYDSL